LGASVNRPELAAIGLAGRSSCDPGFTNQVLNAFDNPDLELFHTVSAAIPADPEFCTPEVG
jgi:hypothetical protein